MNAIEEIHGIVESPHQFALDWKEKTGGRVLGFLCTNLPEELIYAAGILPIRLLGANEPEEITKPYIFQAAFCSFVRDCFAQALKNRYDYIDGVAFAQCCPHAREAFLSWKQHMPITFSYELHSPMLLQNRNSKAYLITVLEDFKNNLEELISKTITVEEIDRAIDIYNTNRRLMMRLYDELKSDNSPLKESDIAEVALAGMLIDKETHNRILNDLIEELPQHESKSISGPRLMLLGSVNNDIELIRFIESLGGRVVIDDYCTGNRYYQTEVVPEENRLAALAERLISKPPCPLHDLPGRERITHQLKLIDEYRVKGVIYTMQRQCDAHGFDYPSVESSLKEKGVRMLKLELDYTVPIGQFRTRIEAFLEMLNIP